MREMLKARLERAFQLTHDLVAHLDEAALDLDLPNLPSNRISGQLWCVLGARESIMHAIESGGWKGFSCSVAAPISKQPLLAVLEATQARLGGIDFASLSDAQFDLVLDLLEHEIQHHGQLMRFVYGNRLTFPESWTKRYTV